MRIASLTVPAMLTASALAVTSGANAAELSAAHVNPPGEPSHEAFNYLSERIAEEDFGLVLEIFPSGEVGGEVDAVEQTQIGAISMTTIATAALSNVAPSVGVFDIPFLFRDHDQHPWAVVDSDIGAEVEERIFEESGLEVIAWWSAGLRHMLTTDRPIVSPEDMQGLRVRTMESPAYLDLFAEMGAESTPTPYGEVYTSLQTGVIDAAENDTFGYRFMSFYEVAPIYSLTGHSFLYKPVVANPDHLARMSDEQRERFDALLTEATEMQRNMFADGFEENIAWFEEQGIEVVEVDRDAFREAAQPVIDKYMDEFGEDLIERILAAN